MNFIEALEMLAQLELLLVEGAGHLEHHVAEHEGGIENRDFRIAFRNKFAIHVHNAFCAHRAFLK
jgi:hypothetical protein